MRLGNSESLATDPGVDVTGEGGVLEGRFIDVRIADDASVQHTHHEFIPAFHS